jgi:uncharacterized membrane protein YfcA
LDHLELIGLALVGVVAGWMNVMAGGGSLLTLPALLFFGVPAPVANGTNRIGILLQSVAAVSTFLRKGFADFRLSVTLAAAASVGAVAGASVGIHLTGIWFDRFLAGILIVIMLLMATGQDAPTGDGARSGAPRRTWIGHLCMVGAGFWGGMIQVGVGFVLMPILYRVMGFDLVRVNMHKVFIVLIYTPVALAVFSAHVEILWTTGLVLALGMMAGGWLGAHSTIRFGRTWIRRVLFVLLSAFVAKLLWP